VRLLRAQRVKSAQQMSKTAPIKGHSSARLDENALQRKIHTQNTGEFQQTASGSSYEKPDGGKWGLRFPRI
jgi:hypothetical protein